MVSALSKAFGQLSDPASRRVIWTTLSLSAALLLLVWALAVWGLSAGAAGLQVWLGAEGFWASLLEWLVGLGGFVALLFASAILFPGVAAGIISGLFIDRVCQAVEARHYPGLPPAREQPFAEALGDGLKLLAVTVGLNLLLLPLYLIAAPLAPFVFFGVNGYLFGREYFEMIAVRRTPSRQVRDLRQQHGGKVFFAGLVIALLMWIPIFNIIVPLVAAAFMLHVFEDLRDKSAGASIPIPRVM